MNFPNNEVFFASTAETKDRLKNASSFGDFLKRNRENMLEADLSKYLMELLAQKGLKRARWWRTLGWTRPLCTRFSTAASAPPGTS